MRWYLETWCIMHGPIHCQNELAEEMLSKLTTFLVVLPIAHVHKQQFVSFLIDVENYCDNNVGFGDSRVHLQ